MSSLGIDLGTTGVRATAFSTDGSVVATGSRQLTLHRPAPGYVEQDPAELVDAVEATVLQVASTAAAHADAVEALALSVHGEAVLPVDKYGEALAGIPVSMDTRGADAARRIEAGIGAAQFTRLTGQPLNGMFSAFKIAAGDQRWQTAASYRCIGDFLTQRWTGRPVIDSTSAARTGVFDVDHQQWSDELLSAFAEFAPWLRRETLSEPNASGRCVAQLNTVAAARLGLPSGLPVVTGAHDQAAGYLGAGGEPGRISVIGFGSSDCITAGTTTRPDDLGGTGFATYRVDETTWLTLAGTAAGGWSLEWFAGVIGRTVDDVFAHVSPEPPTLLVLPYLAGLDTNPDARGVFFGLSLETTVPQLARAVVESAGFEFANMIEALSARGIETGRLHVTGSGAQNIAALNIRANAAGTPLVPVLKDASARGAAILAARGAAITAPGLLAQPAPIATAQQPAQDLHGWYQAQRNRYQELYRSTAGITIPAFTR